MFPHPFKAVLSITRSVWLVLLSLYVSVGVHAQEQVTGWHTTLESAQRAARETGRPLFVVFRCVR